MAISTVFSPRLGAAVVVALLSACGAAPAPGPTAGAGDDVPDISGQFDISAADAKADAVSDVSQSDVAADVAKPDAAAPDAAAKDVADAAPDVPATPDAKPADVTPPDSAVADTAAQDIALADAKPADVADTALVDIVPDSGPADSADAVGPAGDAASVVGACGSGMIWLNGACSGSGAAVHAGDSESVSGNTVSLYLLPPGNLLLNGGAEAGDLSGWTVTNGGDAWLAASGDAPFGSRYFRGSYAWGYLAQTVDLLAAGISAADLDSAIPLHLGVFGIGWGFGDMSGKPDTIKLTVSYQDASGAELGTWASGDIGLEVGVWGSAATDSATYPVGTRKVVLTIGSTDGEYWAGNYGPTIDGGNVSVGTLEIRMSNGDGVWSAWQTFAAVVTNWSLTPGSGPKTVQVEFRDGAGVSLGIVTDALSVQ